MKFEHKALLLGGIAGALIGLAAAYLYVRSNEGQIAAIEAGEADAVAKVSPREVLGVGLSIVQLVRQIVGLGQAA
jgi:predicted metal-dependent hydrolase